MTNPFPGLTGASVCSSIHPLNTEPKPPSPTTLSGRKFLVAVLSSLKVKLFKLEDFKMSPSDRGVGGTEGVETLLLKPLKPCSSLLPSFDLTPVHVERKMDPLFRPYISTLTTNSAYKDFSTNCKLHCMVVKRAWKRLKHFRNYISKLSSMAFQGLKVLNLDLHPRFLLNNWIKAWLNWRQWENPYGKS